MNIESIADTIKPKRVNSPSKMPPIELLNDLFLINDDFRLVHKKRRFGVKVGSVAGNENSNGYVRVKVNGVLYLAHRVIYYMATGIDPNDDEIDHADGNPRNNNPSNLRVATHGQNQQNGGRYKNNSTGYRGVYWHSQHRKYAAVIQVDKKRIHIGLYRNKDDAATAYNEAAKNMFGEFARLNEVIK